jgi:hypothetical protein
MNSIDVKVKKKKDKWVQTIYPFNLSCLKNNIITNFP